MFASERGAGVTANSGHARQKPTGSADAAALARQARAAAEEKKRGNDGGRQEKSVHPQRAPGDDEGTHVREGRLGIGPNRVDQMSAKQRAKSIFLISLHPRPAGGEAKPFFASRAENAS